MKINSYAINFEYLLLDYYKKLGLNDEEVLVLLMIKHILENEPSLITAQNLSMKMNASIATIDDLMNNLYVKGYIDVVIENNKTITSLAPAYEKLFASFSASVEQDKIFSSDMKLEADRKEVVNSVKELFGRELSAIEEESVTNWIKSGTEKSVILNSIKDAKSLRQVDINALDRLILIRMRDEDNYGNAV